jgi:hypothetical protein
VFRFIDVVVLKKKLQPTKPELFDVVECSVDVENSYLGKDSVARVKRYWWFTGFPVGLTLVYFLRR